MRQQRLSERLKPALPVLDDGQLYDSTQGPRRHHGRGDGDDRHEGRERNETD